MALRKPRAHPVPMGQKGWWGRGGDGERRRGSRRGEERKWGRGGEEVGEGRRGSGGGEERKWGREGREGKEERRRGVNRGGEEAQNKSFLNIDIDKDLISSNAAKSTGFLNAAFEDPTRH